MMDTSIVDTQLWDQAQWKAVVFGADGTNPPLLGLAFKNREAAEQIFREWRGMFGQVDSREEIRVSIIEGEIPGEAPGYTVHINGKLEEQLKRNGFHAHDAAGAQLVMAGRFQRMQAANGSRNLELFKHEFARLGRYFLVPVILDDQDKLELLVELAIGKCEVLLRQANEIPENDLDYGVIRG